MLITDRGFADRYASVSLVEYGGGRYGVTAVLRDGNKFVSFGPTTTLAAALERIGVEYVEKAKAAA